MIESFADKDTEDFYRGVFIKKLQNIAAVAARKLAMLAAAESPDDLRVPPGNRLELLKGDRSGQYSIRINDQYRICFRWNNGAYDVEIVDYH